MPWTGRTAAGWVTLAAVVGFAVALTFSTWLRWDRSAFVLAHAGVSLLLFGAFAARFGIVPQALVRPRRVAGIIVGLLAGGLLAYGVQGQVPSGRPEGGALVGAILWLGIVYGALDALLLTIVPVLSVSGGRPAGGPDPPAARIGRAAVSLFASLAVTGAYHLGFAEFRGPGLVQPLIGNGIVTSAYLIAGNPLAPLLAHVIMHVAAVLHGSTTTVQLPPHY